MGKNDVNWDAACELVKADKNRKGPQDVISVQGLAMTMRKHQVIAAYWMEENLMKSEEDLIWGLKEDGVSSQLSSDARIVGFLQARCLSGCPRAHIYITPYRRWI